MSSRASFSACSVAFAYRPGGNPAEPSELQAYSNTGTISRAHILSGIRTNGDTIDSFSTSPDSSGLSASEKLRRHPSAGDIYPRRRANDWSGQWAIYRSSGIHTARGLQYGWITNGRGSPHRDAAAVFPHTNNNRQAHNRGRHKTQSSRSPDSRLISSHTVFSDCSNDRLSSW